MKTFYNVKSIGEKLSNSFEFEMKRRNFHDIRLLTNWNYIFGDLSKKLQPCKISFSGVDKNNCLKKILYVSTQDRGFVVEFIFYKQQILDKLNQYFGTNKSIFTDIKIQTME